MMAHRFHTLSMPPRLVTSTKRRCKSSGLPPMVGILQSREKLNLISDYLKFWLAKKESFVFQKHPTQGKFEADKQMKKSTLDPNININIPN